MGGMFTERKEKMIKIELNRMILSDIRSGDIAASLKNEEIIPLFEIPVDDGEYPRITKKVCNALGIVDGDDDYGCNSVDGKTLTIGGIAVKFDSPERTIIIGMPTSKETCPITVFKPKRMFTSYYPYRKARVTNPFIKVIPEGSEYAVIRNTILASYNVTARPDNHTVLVIGGIGVMFEDNKICFGTDIVVGDW